MNNGYKQRIQKISKWLEDSKLADYARKENSHAFSRNRKMPLKDILLSCLSKKGLTTAFELRNYFKQNEVNAVQLSVQGYLQQRKRLNPTVFSFLNREYLIDFYHSEEVNRWNGYLLLAIDGSKAEVPNSEENRKTFGISNNQKSKIGQVRALVSGMYDILNRFYLDIEIEHISVSENELAKRNLIHLKELEIQSPILIIFDRGYPSLEFIDFLETNKLYYLFRLSSNDYVGERTRMKSYDENVVLKHSSQRLYKIYRKHPDRYEAMKQKGETCVRIVTSKLPSEKELILLTNLPNQFSSKQLSDLYYQRWEIEKKYHTLKNKMKLESVTGKASIYVYQDFWSQVLVYNMMQDIRKSADREIFIIGKRNGTKYPMHTNENIAIGLFKECMIKIILQKEQTIRMELLKELEMEMTRYVLPIRKLPTKERRKNLSNKYHNNQKYSF